MSMITQRVGMAAPLRPAPKEKTTEAVYAEKVTRTALFQGLIDKEIHAVINIGQEKNYNPGDVVFKEGDEAVHIFIIESGKLAIQTAAGQTIYTALPGDILGWSTLMLPYNRTASAIAVDKASVIIIDQLKLQEFCDKYPAIGYKITRNVGRIIAIRMRTAKAMPADVVYG